MKVCSSCGAQMPDENNACTNCGTMLNGQTVPENNQVPPAENQAPPVTPRAPVNYTSAPIPEEKGSIAWGILGFLIPIVGFILFFAWNGSRPGDAKTAGTGALIGFVINLISLMLRG